MRGVGIAVLAGELSASGSGTRIAGLSFAEYDQKSDPAADNRRYQGDSDMCILCAQGKPQNHFGSRRNFLNGAAATGLAAAGLNLFGPRPATADEPPMDSGKLGRRYIIRGGSVMSLDSQVGDFPQADVLVEGKKIRAVGPNLYAGGGAEIDATGRIVMPGFIDTHHHQFETVLRSFLADGVLINDGSGSPSGS